MADAAQPDGGFPVKTAVTLTESAQAAVRAGINPNKVPATVYTADGAIDPTAGFVILAKTSAIAATLAAPTAAQAGQELVITAGTAYAHVVTATGLLDDGVTGGAKNAWTSAAFVGSSITLRAYNLHWTVISKQLGTVA